MHVWATAVIAPTDVVIQKVSGALTNAVFFVSCPSVPAAHTVLLRVYGSSSGCLISRPRELHILHVLSSKYKIGPRVYGTYDNGRIEEFFDSVTLTAADIRDPEISRWIGARMAELHSVDIESVGVPNPTAGEDQHGFDIAVNIYGWLAAAEEVLALSGVSEGTRQELDLPRFKAEWVRYLAWALERPHSFGSRRVFAHNDAQYGNLLRLRDGSEGVDEHRQVRPPSALHFSTAERPLDHRRGLRVRGAKPRRVRHREPLPRVDRKLSRRRAAHTHTRALPLRGGAAQLLRGVHRARGDARGGPARRRRGARGGGRRARPRRARVGRRVARGLGDLGRRAGARGPRGGCGHARVRLHRLRAGAHGGVPRGACLVRYLTTCTHTYLCTIYFLGISFSYTH